MMSNRKAVFSVVCWFLTTGRALQGGELKLTTLLRALPAASWLIDIIMQTKLEVGLLYV